MRDHSLDLIKGLACILMVFAHSYVRVDDFAKLMTFFGSFAPVLFFAVSGITADIQARKYAFPSVLILCVLLFLFGLTYVGLVSGHYYKNFQMDILQIIALGVLLLYLLQRFFRPVAFVHLFLAVFVYLCKVLLDYMPGVLQNAGSLQGIIVEPGNFVLIPWLFPFFLGMFCYKTDNINNVWLAMFAIGGLGFLWLAGLPLEVYNRWDMTTGFFLFAVVLTSLTFYFSRLLSASVMENFFPWLLWLGKNSLVFLYLHVAVILFINAYFETLSGTYWVWLMSSLVALFGIRYLPALFKRIGVTLMLEYRWGWSILMLLVLSAPLLAEATVVLQIIGLILGVIFAFHYSLLGRLVRG